MARLPKTKTVQQKPRARFSDEYGLLLEMLIELRLNAKITQQQMAQHVNKSQSHISMWERKESEMSVVDVLKWCKAVGMSAGDFFSLLEKRLESLPKP